ncbi:ABC transporter permease [Pontibacter mangrovi]|uniref:FtsX-like permease family protein n=1 Tax=Pontibacter mangrovi TaxID=2589816 RepID=A0A501VZR0_9BACT|nr:ABC transporter permease [Pontibacter mangrovi]TPE43213.1 FtsX-like permease family protein [Pontibacter mangrovi]
MLKMYFLTAARSLWRNKSYSLLNVAGLALGITCSILLFLVIQYQLSYDSFHTKADRIYRLNVDFPERDFHTPASHFPLPELMRSNGNLGLEEVTQMVGRTGAQINIAADGDTPPKKFLEDSNIGFVEPSFFSIFDFNTGPINPAPYFKEPNVVVLTQSLADKYFPEENPVGKVIRYNNQYNLKVVSVMPDMPGNTEFPFVMLVSYKTLKNELSDDWGNLSSDHQTYALLPKQMSPETAQEAVNSFVAKHNDQKDLRNSMVYMLQPLNDLHHNPSYYGGFAQTPVSREMLLAMAAVGIVLLLTACINFINLATAQAIKRAKEVGIRKVLGSNRWQLVLQFMSETLLIVVSASLFSIILVELALPHLNELLDLQITFSLLDNKVLLLFLIAQALLVTLFAGFYPAFVLSGFEPTTALKSRMSMQRVGGISLRQVLVVLQFTICQVLIICTFLVNEQMNFFRSKPLGFDKEAVVLVTLPRETSRKMQALRQELLSNPAVREVSFGSDAPSSGNISYGNFYFNHASEDEGFQIHKKFADKYYFQLYDMHFLAGNAYANADSLQYMVINDALRRKLGLKTPEEALGKNLSFGGKQFSGPIVGVVDDFHQSSLAVPIEPLVITKNPVDYVTLSVKINMAQKQEALQHLEQLWDKVYPDDVFSYQFLDESIAQFYEDEARQNTLFKVFSVIAIFIGCLGLYGLVAFMAAQRTKEVGIRKVMGASVFHITALFSKEFVKLVMIAFLLAVPIAYYLMDLWLQDYSYRISISYWPFIMAGFATLAIALITMSTQAVKAALANPVLSLKTE